MSGQFLTVHTLTALPWHNLNRDESGAPKQVTEGGVTRARLSSQSLKRAARTAFERDTEHAEASLRTKVATTVILDRVAELRGELTADARKKLEAAVSKRVNALTQAGDTDTVKKDTLVWLSSGEVELVAQTYARAGEGDVIQATSTDSLAIAAFGRMFAAAPELRTPAAVSVGDAVTTHAATIELDWFAAVEDGPVAHSGAGQLGFTMQTTGVYYRSFTIDRRQLARNFDLPLDSAEAEPQLRSFIRHLTLALPTGRSSGTAAHTLPALVIAEEQSARFAYDFHEPITASEQGFLAPSIHALLAKRDGVRGFDPDLFGKSFLTGTHPLAQATPEPSGSFSEYTDFVLTFLRGTP